MEAQKTPGHYTQWTIKPASSYLMSYRHGTNYALFSIVFDILGTVAIFLLADTLFNIRFAQSAGAVNALIVTGLMTVTWMVVFFMLSVYEINRMYRFLVETRKVITAVVLSTLILMGLLYVMELEIPRVLLAAHLSLDTAFLIGWRLAVRFGSQIVLKGQIARPKRIMMLGFDERIDQTVQLFDSMPQLNLHVIGAIVDDVNQTAGSLNVLGTPNDNIHTIVAENQIDEVIVAPSWQQEKGKDILMQLQTVPVYVRLVPSYLSLSVYKPEVEDIGGLPFITLSDSPLTLYQRLLKRAFDLSVALILVILTLPVMATVAAIIKMTDKGPFLFVQERVGQNGRMFKIFKFRSMYVDADERLEEVAEYDENGKIINHKMENDPRVTPIGRIIRKTSLDELPQLFNVILGDMSLVGPRPELPKLVNQYESWQRRRLVVPPGITGWWQINGRSEVPCHDPRSTKEDLHYIENYSFWLDIYILVMTLPAVIRGKGAF